MRIMHISTRLILGGSQENTVLSCEGQATDGHDVSIVHGPIYGPEGSLQARAAAHGGIELIESANLCRDLAPLRDFRCLGDLKSLVRSWAPDVVHTHSSKAGILGRMAAWACDVPCVVHTIHGLPFHPYQSWWRNRIYIAAERMAARRCHRIACVADAMRDQALAKGIGRPAQFETIYSGMEVERYAQCDADRAEIRASLGLDEHDYVVGTISRLAELKGHDDLLDAIGGAMVADKRLKLLWVGDGWWRARLERRLASMGLADQVVLTGLVEPDDIPRHLAAMDLLVHPSWREGLPRTVVQALLARTPVVAHDVDGTGEVCIDGQTGRLVAPGDHAALRAAVEESRDDPAEAARQAERGYDLCKSRFDGRLMVERLDELYRSILGS